MSTNLPLVASYDTLKGDLLTMVIDPSPGHDQQMRDIPDVQVMLPGCQAYPRMCYNNYIVVDQLKPGADSELPWQPQLLHSYDYREHDNVASEILWLQKLADNGSETVFLWTWLGEWKDIDYLLVSSKAIDVSCVWKNISYLAVEVRPHALISTQRGWGWTQT